MAYMELSRREPGTALYDYIFKQLKRKDVSLFDY